MINSSITIQQDSAEVQPKEVTNTVNACGHKAIIKEKPEGVLERIEENLFTQRLQDPKPFMAAELKEHISFGSLLEADGHKLQTSGKCTKCCCPFHPDKTPSFCILEDDAHARCYGCSWYGDIFKYEQMFNGIEFKEAWWRLNDFIRSSPRTGRKAKAAPKKVKTAEPVFTPAQLKERKLYAARLANEPWLAEKVCALRFERSGEQWNPVLIRHLAKDGFLGWADCLAFIYPRGTKYRRWPGKEFIWETDGASLWRGELLTGAKHIYLTESETDAIALLHTDLEKESGTVIIAVSGAGNFQSDWAPLFKGKKVTLCFDNDDAGEKGAHKTGLLLKPFVSELLTLNLGGAK